MEMEWKFLEKHTWLHMSLIYNDLFGEPEITVVSIDGLVYSQLNDEEVFSTGEFSTEEIKKVVFGPKHNKVVGPDGLHVEFYRVLGCGQV